MSVGVETAGAHASAYISSLYYTSSLLATFKDFPFSSPKIKNQFSPAFAAAIFSFFIFCKNKWL